MAKKYRIGILGLGHWYSAYRLAWSLPGYQKAELVAVASKDKAKSDEFAQTFGIDSYTTYDELVARDDIDLVHVCPPVVDLPEATIKAAKAGKHIVLGKPMAMNLQQADEMVKAVRDAGVVCFPFQGMFRMAAAGLKKRIESGEIGDIVLMSAGGRWGIAEDWMNSGKGGWFTDPKQTPGGALIDEGIYAMDQLRWLAGSEVVEVEARIANLVHKDIAPLEDWGRATFTYANGIIGTVEAGWTIVSPRRTGPSPKENSVRKLEIVGTRGEIIQNELVPGLAVLGKDARQWVVERPAPAFMAAPSPTAVDHLISCIESGQEPIESIEDARTALKIGLAAYEAAKSGKPVKLS